MKRYNRANETRIFKTYEYQNFNFNALGEAALSHRTRHLKEGLRFLKGQEHEEK